MTGEIARALGATVVRHPRNLGYGAALQTIFREARRRNPDVLVVLDADGQHDPDEIPKLVKPVLEGRADVVIGSRFLGSARQPAWRRLGVKLITWLAKRLYGLPSWLTDAQSGYRAYSRRAISLIMPEDPGMGASIDILEQAARYGLRIAEVPVTIGYHGDSSSQNPVAHAASVVVRMLELTVERRPLLYLGLPGALATVAGLTLLAYSLWLLGTAGPPTPLALALLGLALTATGLAAAAAAMAVRAARLAVRELLGGLDERCRGER
jgi:glycosyltransferase involved in cell wall biosynthesis